MEKQTAEQLAKELIYVARFLKRDSANMMAVVAAAHAIRTLESECRAMRACYHFVECKYCGPFHPDTNVDCGNCDGFGRAPPECMQTDPETHMRAAEKACAATDTLGLLGD